MSNSTSYREIKYDDIPYDLSDLEQRETLIAQLLTDLIGMGTITEAEKARSHDMLSLMFKYTELPLDGFEEDIVFDFKTHIIPGLEESLSAHDKIVKGLSELMKDKS